MRNNRLCSTYDNLPEQETSLGDLLNQNEDYMNLENNNNGERTCKRFGDTLEIFTGKAADEDTYRLQEEDRLHQETRRQSAYEKWEQQRQQRLRHLAPILAQRLRESLSNRG